MNLLVLWPDLLTQIWEILLIQQINMCDFDYFVTVGMLSFLVCKHFCKVCIANFPKKVLKLHFPFHDNTNGVSNLDHRSFHIHTLTGKLNWPLSFCLCCTTHTHTKKSSLWIWSTHWSDLDPQIFSQYFLSWLKIDSFTSITIIIYAHNTIIFKQHKKLNNLLWFLELLC